MQQSDGPHIPQQPQPGMVPGHTPPKKKKGFGVCGCLAGGCLLAVLVVGIAVGVGIYYGKNFLQQKILEYTDDTPRPVPTMDLGQGEPEQAKQKVEQFITDFQQGSVGGSLELGSREVNALISAYPETQGRAYVGFQGDRVDAQLSIGLHEIFPDGLLGITDERYLNGRAKFGFRYEAGHIYISVDELEGNGQAVPAEMLSQMSNLDLDIEEINNPDVRKALRRFERIEVVDGRLVLIPLRK